MNIVKKQTGNELLIELSGSLDTMTAPELDKVIRESLNDVKSLVFDFSKVDYVSSAGLRVLLVAYKVMQQQGTMVLRHVNSDIMDVFSITGFVEFLQIEN